ncbi:hypothetical protein [Methylobacterium sp. CM6257]|jgi:hypothetical protein
MYANNLHLDALTAITTAWQISTAMRTKGPRPEPCIDLTPDQALKLGEWLVDWARRGVTHQTIEGRKTGF